MYGGGMYGQPGGMMGPGVDPNDPNSLTNSFSQSTQATFQIIENLVGAFGGVAQMLESTYMATHQGFFGTPPSLCHADVVCLRQVHLTRSNSHRFGSRTILDPPHNTWFYPWNLHLDALRPHPHSQAHWSPTTS